MLFVCSLDTLDYSAASLFPPTPDATSLFSGALSWPDGSCFTYPAERFCLLPLKYSLWAKNWLTVVRAVPAVSHV